MRPSGRRVRRALRPPMRALVYLRVSTTGQAEGFSLASQREACERRARELGAGDVLCLEDTYTGLELDRPALRRLRECVARRGLDLVVVYDPDRLSRDLADLLVLTREFEAAGVRLEFVSFDWEKTPQGMLFLQLRGAIAQFEHALIRERTQRGKLKKAALGRLRTCARPYGYSFDPRTDELHPDPYQAAVVRRIFRWYTQDGLSSHAIARRLAAEGVPAPRGRAWHPSTVYRLLGSETYAGRLRRRDEQPDWLPVLTPAIVDRELWERAQEVRRRGRGAQGRGRRLYLLGGLLRCGLCGRRLHGTTRVRGDRAWTYYVCPGRYRRAWGPGAGEACRLRPVRCDRLDAAVWAAVASGLEEAGWDPALWPGQVENARGAELARLQDELAAVEEGARRLGGARERVHRVYFAGLLEEGEHRRFLGELAGQEARVALEAGRLRAGLEALAAPCPGGPAPPDPGQLRSLLAALSWQGRRTMLQAVVREVRLFPGRALVLTPLAAAGGARPVVAAAGARRVDAADGPPSVAAADGPPSVGAADQASRSVPSRT